MEQVKVLEAACDEGMPSFGFYYQKMGLILQISLLEHWTAAHSM